MDADPRSIATEHPTSNMVGGGVRVAMRSPNKSQYWHCARCGKQTVHEIPDLDSDWAYLSPGMNGFERWRRCTDCHENLKTVEIKADELRKLQTELEQLRKTKIQHEQLLAALRDRSAADRRVNAFVHPKTEGMPNQATHVTQAASQPFGTS